MVLFILKKSSNIANLLFVMTPILFTTILIFNMLNYFGNIINNFLLWIPYLIAPLGMLLSSLYILNGPGFHKNRNLILFVFFYVFISLNFSFFPNPFQFGQLSGLQQGLMHFLIVIPLVGTIYFFIKILPEIPDQKSKIYSLLFGLLFVVLGSLLRTFDYILNNQESTIGMIIIVLGSILALQAFSTFRNRKTINGE